MFLLILRQMRVKQFPLKWKCRETYQDVIKVTQCKLTVSNSDRAIPKVQQGFFQPISLVFFIVPLLHNAPSLYCADSARVPPHSRTRNLV